MKIIIPNHLMTINGKPSTILKVLYISSVAVIAILTILITLAIVGVSYAAFRGEEIPIIVPTIFIIILMLLIAGLHASGITTVLRNIWGHKLLVTNQYEIDRLRERGYQIEVRRHWPWKTKIYHVKNDVEMIVFKVTLLAPYPREVYIHLVPHKYLDKGE